MRCLVRHGARNTAAEYILVSCHLPGNMDINTEDDKNDDARPVVVVLFFVHEGSNGYPEALVLSLVACTVLSGSPRPSVTLSCNTAG